MVPASHCGTNAPLNVVTGAFGFTGRHIAARLLFAGERVRTLTGHSGKNVTWRDQVDRAPLTFENFGELVRSMRARLRCTTPTGCDSRAMD